MRHFITFDNPELEKIAQKNRGREDIQPGVEPETGKLLSFFVNLIKAVKVLELGTGIAESSIWIGEALKKNKGMLYTVDNHSRTFREAEKNIRSAGLEKSVSMVFCDAEEALENFLQSHENSFDMVFQDCGKYLYPRVHEKLLRLTRPGGIIIADDTLFSEISHVRRNLGTYTDQYNRMVFSDPRVYPAIIPAGHGLTVMVKI